MAIPRQLEPDEERVLKIILERGLIRGGDLMRRADMNSRVFKGLVERLLERDLIQTSGELSEAMLPFATFDVRPSQRPDLRMTIR
jgi:DNA-binding MarR family transcriptional regulator